MAITKNKTEPIFVTRENEVIELKDQELVEFLEQREKDNLASEQLKIKQEEEKAIRISAYKKLGLTDEEIAAII